MSSEIALINGLPIATEVSPAHKADDRSSVALLFQLIASHFFSFPQLRHQPLGEASRFVAYDSTGKITVSDGRQDIPKQREYRFIQRDSFAGPILAYDPTGLFEKGKYEVLEDEGRPIRLTRTWKAKAIQDFLSSACTSPLSNAFMNYYPFTEAPDKVVYIRLDQEGNIYIADASGNEIKNPPQYKFLRESGTTNYFLAYSPTAAFAEGKYTLVELDEALEEGVEPSQERGKILLQIRKYSEEEQIQALTEVVASNPEAKKALKAELKKGSPLTPFFLEKTNFYLFKESFKRAVYTALSRPFMPNSLRLKEMFLMIFGKDLLGSNYKERAHNLIINQARAVAQIADEVSLVCMRNYRARGGLLGAFDIASRLLGRVIVAFVFAIPAVPLTLLAMLFGLIALTCVKKPEEKPSLATS